MFDKKTLLNHINNNSNHNVMTQAGINTGFGLQKQVQVKQEPEEEKYEVIEEAYYDQ
jgi:histidine ammonia-lyase